MAKTNVERGAERRAQMKRDGRCVDCSAPAVPGKTRCPDCLAKRAERAASSRARMKRDGRCARCSAPAVPGKTRCPECAAKLAERDAARRARMKLLKRLKQETPF